MAEQKAKAAADIQKKATRNDVARLAGVSPAVVSYVINSSKFVSEEKKKAVLNAIKTLDYRPNLQARSLKTNRSMMIAFVCDNLRNEWLEGAENLLFENGYYVSHCYSKDDADFIRRLIARQFDAVFMMSNRYSTAQLNELAESGISVVLYKTRNYGELNPKIVTVAPDYYDGIRKSVSYLVLKGHERIAIIPPVRYLYKGIQGDGYRLDAYKKALESYGLPVREEYICKSIDSMKHILSGVFDMLTMNREQRPTAMICGNDWMAVQIMQYIQEMGMKVPQDVALMGADNTYLASVVNPSLTSIDFSKEDFCNVLSETILGLLDGERRPDRFLPVSVVARASA